MKLFMIAFILFFLVNRYLNSNQSGSKVYLKFLRLTFGKHDTRVVPLFMIQKKIYTRPNPFIFSIKIEKLSEKSNQREPGLVGFEFQ
jgi:hypothetical protein